MSKFYIDKNFELCFEIGDIVVVGAFMYVNSDSRDRHRDRIRIYSVSRVAHVHLLFFLVSSSILSLLSNVISYANHRLRKARLLNHELK